MNIFSKQTRENYNESLEKILEKKNFSSETKNLLLSMLYKIENSYEDYYKVKPIAESKQEYITRILYIIQEECEELETVTPKTEASKILEEINKNCIVDIKKGKIVVYANEKDILYSLIELDERYILYKYNNKLEINDSESQILIKAVEEFLVEGKAMSKSEAIRDFNGWSWSSNVTDIEDISINLIYQNILLLTGNIMNNIVRNNENEIIANAEDLSKLNEKNEDINNNRNKTSQDNKEINLIKMALEKIFLKNKVSEMIKYINIILYSNLIKQDVEIRYKFESKLKKIKKQLELMQNKEEFLKFIVKEKKNINEKIKRLDETLNNKELLEEEYIRRNKSLSNEEKIFSISHLDNIMEEERKQLIQNYKYLNKLIEPQEYINEKERIREEYVFFKQIVDAIDKDYRDEIVKDIQIEFLNCLKVKIEAAETKEELTKLLYDFRYYCVLPINELQQIKDVPALRKAVAEVMNILIDKSIDRNVIENISNSISLCYNTLKYVFETRIIDLEKLYIKISSNNENGMKDENTKEKIYNILISLYDYKSEEEKYQTSVNNLELLNIKVNKKIALFL